MRQTLKWSGLAGIAALVVMAASSFNAMPASARTNSQDTVYNGGRMSGYADPYSQPGSRGRGRGHHAWGRGNSYGNRDGRGQYQAGGNNGRGNSRNGQWNQGGSWNNEGRDPQGQGRRRAGGQGGGNRHGNQNGSGDWRDQGNRDN